MRSVSTVVAVLFLAALSARAEDPPPDGKPADPPPAPAEPSKPGPPPTPEQAADAVLAAVKAKDDAALKALADKDHPDPWLVADELCARGEQDAAEAYAKAAPRADVEDLPAYVRSRRGQADDTTRRSAVAAANAAVSGGRWQQMLEAAGGAAPATADDLLGVRLSTARGTALRGLGRLDEAGRAFLVGADGAERIGWLARAATALDSSGMAAHARSDFRVEIPIWERLVRLNERRGDRVGLGWALGNLGLAHADSGDDARALEVEARALGIAEESGNRDVLAQILNNLGSVHQSLGQYAKATECLERSLAIRVERNDERGAAQVLGNLGNVFRAQGDLARALDHYGRALAANERSGNEHAVAIMLGNIGGVHEEGAPPKAIELCERAQKIFERLGDRLGVARMLLSLGNARHAQGEYAIALALRQRALTLQEEIGARGGQARTLGCMGQTYRALGDLPSAIEHFGRSLRLAEAIGDRECAAETLKNLGDAYFARLEYQKAIEAHERARRGFEELGFRARAAGAVHSLGIDHQSVGNYPKAIECLERARALYEALGDSQRSAGATQVLADSHHHLGNYARALELGQQALSVFETSGSRAGVAYALNSLGNLHDSLGDHAQALQMKERALTMFQELGDRRQAGTVLGNVGLSHDLLGDHVKALECYERARRIEEELGDRSSVAWTLDSMGNAHQRLGDPARAIELHTQALELQEALGERSEAARTRINLAEALHRRGDEAAARGWLDKAIREAERLRSDPDLAGALWNLARIQLAANDATGALASAKRAIPMLERMFGGLAEEQSARAREGYDDLFAVGALAASRTKDIGETVYFLESGRAGAFLESLGGRQAMRWAVIPENLRGAEDEARGRVAAATSDYRRALEGGDRGAIRAAAQALDAAQARVSEVIERIQREAKKAPGVVYPRAATLEEIQGWLEPTDALVLYGFCLDELLALVLTPTTARIVSLGESAATAAACAALDLGTPAGDPTAALGTLRRLVVDPLTLGDGVRRVVVSPDGPLSYVSFGPLLPGRVVVYVPSATTYGTLLDEQAATGRRVLALGDPDYGAPMNPLALDAYHRVRGGRLAPLSGTRLEANEVGDVVLLGRDASEGGLRAALANSTTRWHAVHLACHGLIDAERPTRSSLALTPDAGSDGFLTALEVLRSEIPADLAILSACETAKGRIVRGEGIVGLTRAFMFAGAPRVIVSLWKVDDEATRALMVKFYELWNPKDGKPGLPTAAALKQAQEFVRSHEKWKHPYYWAAWVLWGLPS